MKRKALVVMLLVIGSGVSYNLFQQIYNSLQAGYRIDAEVDELTRLQRQNTKLKQELEATKSLPFIEEITRNKLGLVRPGETLVIIPDKEIERVLGESKVQNEVKLPNWLGWLRLFFP